MRFNLHKDTLVKTELRVAIDARRHTAYQPFLQHITLYRPSTSLVQVVVYFLAENANGKRERESDTEYMAVFHP